MFCIIKMVLSKKKKKKEKKEKKKRSAFCENMKCKFSLLLRDLAVL